MELDEMKQLWQQHDKLLQQNKLLNEKLVTNMLQDKAKPAIGRMLGFEYTSVVVCALLLIFWSLQYYTLSMGTLLAVSYIVSLLFIVFGLAFGLYKINLLGKIDLAADSVSATAQKTTSFRRLISKERLYSFILSPLIIASVLVVIAQWVNHHNVIDMLDLYLPRIIIAYALLFIGILIVYKKVYFDSIKQINANLEEIKKFREETV